MDSGNSGSTQSSSGGDDEFDSRPPPPTETLSPFFNPSLNFPSISNHPPPRPQPAQPQQHRLLPPTTMFEPSPPNLGPFPNANSPYNLDFIWSRSEPRSESNYTNLENFTGFSSSSQALLAPGQGSLIPSSSSTAPPPHGDGNGTKAAQRSDQTHVAKTNRKRTRASRRAPTTVLTTDTSNFRQMVQEFTGIPAPPFASSPYGHRFDLFGGGSGLKSASHLETLGSLFPFRPSAHKVQSPSPSSLLNSSLVDPSNIANPNINNTTIATSMAGPSNASNTYQLQAASDHLGFLSKQPQNLLNLQNPTLSFQNLKYPLTNPPIFNSKPQENSSIIPSLDVLGMSHEHVGPNLGGFSSHGSSERAQHQQQFGYGHNGGGDTENFKLNCSASTSEFHPEKGLENASSRSEGTVNPWICPSN
ncbi:uncharacterized protein LOC127798784 [Diospyros lotus]|uniref:uncharacterized protein LOC127798784 n=1 Tax=Diospyros lotus TaxID=55363 RepID=UPI00225452A8|nr:uncharacterized protein LOC127798784 [Diospyros lotus]